MIPNVPKISTLNRELYLLKPGALLSAKDGDSSMSWSSTITADIPLFYLKEPPLTARSEKKYQEIKW